MELEGFLQSVGQGSGLNNTQTNIGTWITTSNMMGYIFGAGGIILLIMLLTSGYQMMMSKGDPKGMQAAQSKITTSLIGIFLIIFAYFITRLILQFFGLDTIPGLFT